MESNRIKTRRAEDEEIRIRSIPQKKRSSFVTQTPDQPLTSIEPVMATENAGSNVANGRLNVATGSFDDVLDLLPRCENDEEPQSKFTVVNVSQKNLSNEFHRGMPDNERRKAADPTSEGPLVYKKLTGIHSIEAAVSNLE